MIEAAAHGVEHANGLPDDLAADAVAGQESNPEMGHMLVFLVVCLALSLSAFRGDSTAGFAVVAAACLTLSQPIPGNAQ